MAQSAADRNPLWMASLLKSSERPPTPVPPSHSAFLDRLHDTVRIQRAIRAASDRARARTPHIAAAARLGGTASFSYDVTVMEMVDTWKAATEGEGAPFATAANTDLELGEALDWISQRLTELVLARAGEWWALYKVRVLHPLQATSGRAAPKAQSLAWERWKDRRPMATNPALLPMGAVHALVPEGPALTLDESVRLSRVPTAASRAAAAVDPWRPRPSTLPQVEAREVQGWESVGPLR